MYNYCTVALISHATKVIYPGKSSIIHKLWNSICSSWIEKRQRNQRSNCQHSLDDRKSKRILVKHLLLLYWPCKSLWLCGSQQIVEKLTEKGIPDHLTCLLRNLYAGQETTVRTEHGTKTGSNLGKEYVKAVYCHLVYITYLQSTSCEMSKWMKHKLESRLLGEISGTSDMQKSPPSWQKLKGN